MSYPVIAAKCFFQVVRYQWSAQPLRPQVVSGTAPNGRQPAANAQSSNANPNAVQPAQGSPNVDTTDPTASTTTQTASGSPTHDSQNVPDVLSTNNHVSAITSFLSRQKEVVKQSSGVAPTDHAHAFWKSFSKEFALERTRKRFRTYDPPEATILLSGKITINGNKRHVLLAVDTDYDPATETWGPIFIEPLTGVRQQALRDSLSNSREWD